MYLKCRLAERIAGCTLEWQERRTPGELNVMLTYERIRQREELKMLLASRGLM